MARDKEQALIEVVLKGQQANASLKEMNNSVNALRAQLNKLPKDSQEFADKKAEFQKMSKTLKDVQNDVKGVGGVFQSIGKEIKGFGIMAAGYLGFQWLSSSVTGIIKSNAELSDSLADIRKTTGMTEAEAKKMNTAFSQIDTRTATKELRNIAIVGGQLGIAKGDIFGFTVAVDKMNVALGDEFTGGAEEVTKAMGGLRNIFSDIKTGKVDQDLLHIGNAINVLASSGAATGPVVSDFANRIGGVGITLGLTSGQVLGLSATLQELNVSTERGGTAVTKILQKMTTNTVEFAKVAKMPVKEFTELVNKDLYGAFVKVVEGSKQGGSSATAFGKILNDLGVDGAGASEVFAKLGNNTKMLGEKVNMAKTALTGTDSIMAEFTTKNATLGAEMERLSKGFASAFTNSTVSDGIKSIVGLFADLFDKTKSVSAGMDEERNTVNALMIEIKSSNVTNERRKEIYDELNAINPEIVAGIDKENISIQDLTKNVIEYNKAQINKIAVQKQQEKIDEQNEIAGEKAKEMAEKQSKALEALGKVYMLNGIVGTKAKKIIDDENLSIAEKIKMVYQLARAQEYSIDKNGTTHRDKEAMEIQNITGAATSLTHAEMEYSKAVKKSNDLVNEKNNLMHMLGIESGAAKEGIDYTKLSIEQLNKYIKDSTESMHNYHAKEGAASIIELKRREQAKKDAILPLDEETKKKLVAAHKKYIDDKIKLEEDFINRHQSADDKSRQAIYDKYKVFLAAEKEGSAAYKDIVFKRDIEIAEFEKKLEERKLKEKTDALNKIKRATQTAEQNEIDDANAKFDELIDVANTYGLSTIELEETRQIALAAIKEKYDNAELEKSKSKNEKIATVEKEHFENKMKLFNAYYQQVSSVLSSWNETQKNMAENQTKVVKNQTTTDLAANKRLYDAKIIGQTEYNRRTKDLETKSAKAIADIKKRAAENDKKIAIFNTLINAGVAIARAFKDFPFPVAAVMAGLAGASAMLQVSAISSQPIPEFAKGGYNKTSDDPQGYTTGATLYTNSASGRNFIAGEKGTEWIASNWMVNDPVIGPKITELEQIRTRGYSMGGYNTDVPQFSSSNKTSTPVFTPSNNSGLENAINRLNQNLEKPFIAQLSYDLMQKYLSAIDSAKASAQTR